MNLEGRQAVVTGGNRGIGLAAVLALAAAGAHVTFTARSESDAADTVARAGTDKVRGIVANVTDHPCMAEVLAGDVDILVNNAGVIEPIGPMAEVSMEAWVHCIAVNLLGAVHAMRCVIPGMLRRGGGTVINLSSGAAHRAMEGWSAYCTSKAALAMAGRAAHLEYGQRGLRVFGFAPGLIDTDMQATIRASGINRISQLDRSDLARPEVAGQAIAFLCNAAADGFTGQEVDIRDPAFFRAAGLEGSR